MPPRIDLFPGAKFVPAKLFTVPSGDWFFERLLRTGGITLELISATAGRPKPRAQLKEPNNEERGTESAPGSSLERKVSPHVLVSGSEP